MTHLEEMRLAYQCRWADAWEWSKAIAAWNRGDHVLAGYYASGLISLATIIVGIDAGRRTRHNGLVNPESREAQAHTWFRVFTHQTAEAR